VQVRESLLYQCLLLHGVCVGVWVGGARVCACTRARA
jgi:hypothetical protein